MLGTSCAIQRRWSSSSQSPEPIFKTWEPIEDACIRCPLRTGSVSTSATCRRHHSATANFRVLDTAAFTGLSIWQDSCMQWPTDSAARLRPPVSGSDCPWRLRLRALRIVYMM